MGWSAWCSRGVSPNDRLAEYIELPNHPWYVATQALPELEAAQRQLREAAGLELVRIPLEDAVTAVHDGTIVDAKTVIGRLLAADRAANGSSSGWFGRPLLSDRLTHARWRYRSVPWMPKEQHRGPRGGDRPCTRGRGRRCAMGASRGSAEVISPATIRTRDFRSVVWGFEAPAVRTFLEDVAATQAALNERVSELEDALAAATAARLELPDEVVDSLEDMRARVAETLQQAAVDVAARRLEADPERDRMLDAAREEAAAVIEEARADTEAHRDELLMAARRERAQVDEEVLALERRRAHLARTLDEIRDRIGDLARTMGSLPTRLVTMEEDWDVA